MTSCLCPAELDRCDAASACGQGTGKRRIKITESVGQDFMTFSRSPCALLAQAGLDRSRLEAVAHCRPSLRTTPGAGFPVGRASAGGGATDCRSLSDEIGRASCRERV